MIKTLIVVQQEEVKTVPSSRSESGFKKRCSIQLKEMGGSYANHYLCTLWDNLAGLRFYPGDHVVASLNFRVRENQGQYYQDIAVTDIFKMNA